MVFNFQNQTLHIICFSYVNNQMMSHATFLYIVVSSPDHNFLRKWKKKYWKHKNEFLKSINYLFWGKIQNKTKFLNPSKPFILFFCKQYKSQSCIKKIRTIWITLHAVTIICKLIQTKHAIIKDFTYRNYIIVQ